MKKILYLTDLYYEAKGRDYFEEDLSLKCKNATTSASCG